MLANKNIFCNTPWYELHIYWDGSMGICCQESHKLYHSLDTQYNISTMSIMDWFNSQPVRTFRKDILADNPLSQCKQCYLEEQHNGDSRRLRSNQKSVIFTRRAFESSFQQSPGYKHFEFSQSHLGETDTYPIDIHVDLGNFCNLACKMCDAKSSSTIAGQHVKWKIESARQYLGTDWTRNQRVWKNFKQQLLEIPGLNNIHFMGGETLLTDRFEDLVDTMIENRRFDLCFSFVSNGTVYKPHLIEKLKQFRRVGIEISIETTDQRNGYIRQGTDTEQVIENIKKYISHCNNTSITVALRPAPSLLSIGSHSSVLKFAIDNKLVIKSNLCYRPRFLNIEILPTSIKQLYVNTYQEFLNAVDKDTSTDFNTSDPTNYLSIAKQQALLCISLLQTPLPEDSDQELQKLVEHCRQWDKVYKLNARELYPEFSEIWDKYDY